MFEREIKFIYDFNLNKVNKLGPYFTFEQLRSIDLHPAILHYISAEIDYLVFEDRQKLLKNSVFDYSGEKISYHFNEITEELKKIKRFSLEYIAKLILHSTSFTINFLVRPKWTLTRFIYDETQHKTSIEIKQILNYIYYYQFLKKIISSYINSKKILSMNLEEFDELLNKADQIGIETNLQAILSHSLVSMAEFFNVGQMQKTRIPLTAVELFLEEKDLPHHLQKLTDTFGNDENARFNIGDYMKVLTSVMITKKEEDLEYDELPLFNNKNEEEQIERHTELVDEESNSEVYNSISVISEDITEKLPDESAVEEFEESALLNEPSNESENELDIAFNNSDSDVEQVLDKWKNEQYFESEEELKETENTINETTEIISSSDEEITIKPHKKIRIKVNEDNKIEPILDNEIEKENFIKSSDEPDDKEVDSYSSIIKNDLSNDEQDEVTNNFNSLQFESQIEDKFSDESEIMFGSLESVDAKHDDSYAQENIISDEKQNSFKDIFEDSENEHRKKDERLNDELKLELAEILEHKSMSKIIEVIFDYDIEDFANMLDEISSARNVEDAHFIINETLSNRRINLNSKEAESLKEIISEYFDRR